MTPTIYIIDDDTSFLAALERLLRAGGYRCESFASATEFIARAGHHQSGCVIVDLQMPGANGFQVQEALAKQDNSLPLIFLTGQGDIRSSVQAIKGGAEDFLTKPVKKDLLFPAIERALARDQQQRAERARRHELRSRFELLTPRELQVLEHVVRGSLNKQIAAELDTSERTIKAHRANIVSKLKVTSVAELVRLTQESGVLLEKKTATG